MAGDRGPVTGLPILNYHGVESKEGEYLWLEGERPYVLSLKSFEEQMDLIRDFGFTSLALTGLDRWFDQREDEERSLMLTFDDGHISHYEHVMPSLKERKLKAVFFVPAGLVGERGQMSWSHLRQMLIEGFEIGSHGLRHISLTRLKEPQLGEEIVESKKRLEDHLGVPVNSFSVPRGFYGPRIGRIAAQAGYRFVFTSQFDLNFKSEDPFCLRRLVVKKVTTLDQFSRIVQGELGFRRHFERFKDLARRFLAPPIYDRLVGMKRVMKVGN